MTSVIFDTISAICPLDTLEMPKLERSIGVHYIMSAYKIMKNNNLNRIFIKNHHDVNHNLTTWNLISFGSDNNDKTKQTFLIKIKSTISSIIDISLTPMDSLL